MYKTLVLEYRNGVATVKLNRPEKLNALNPEMFEDLLKALVAIETNKEIGAVVITGAGQAFSAGGDVHEDIAPLSEKSPAEFDHYLRQATDVYKKIFYLNRPVVAAVNGYAIGAGLDLAMTCDIRIASDKAKFGQFFVKMGLVPEVGLYLMSRLVSLGWAKFLSFTGDLIDAQEAEKIGLVEKTVPAEEFMPFVEKLAEKLANGPTRTIAMIKKGINEGLKRDLDSLLEYISLLQYQSVHTAEHKEAVQAFLEKRKPLFKKTLIP